MLFYLIAIWAHLIDTNGMKKVKWTTTIKRNNKRFLPTIKTLNALIDYRHTHTHTQTLRCVKIPIYSVYLCVALTAVAATSTAAAAAITIKSIVSINSLAAFFDTDKCYTWTDALNVCDG